MRTITLIATGLALALVPATALAQTEIDESDLPDLPRAGKATFNVSLYGVQRFETRTVRQEDPDGGPFNERGTWESRSKVTFNTKRPARAQISRAGSALTLRWLSKGEVALPVTAAFAHSGADEREETGLDTEWEPVQPPDAENCSATLDHLGFDLSFSGGRLTASGASSLVVPLGDPFAGCPWGDRSGGLYGAEGRLPVFQLLEGRETEVVLRFRDRSHSEGTLYRTETRKSSTVYVTFKKVG